jgi:phosphatidate cytidylyltransferase
VSRRGKDDRPRPHPGDPWSPGWTSDEDAAAEAETPAVEDELEESPDRVAGFESAAVEDEVEADAAEAEETAAAGEPAAEGPAEWAEVLGIAPGEPAAPSTAGEGRGDAAQAPADWAQGRLPLEGVIPEQPAEVEAEHLPPPWAPEEAEAREVPGAPLGEEAVGAEVEVEEWLSFAEGSPPPGAAPLTAGEAGPHVDEAPSVVARRRRLWPFGRRAQPTEELPVEWRAEPAEGEGTIAEPGPQPPPWSPEIGGEEAPVDSGFPSPGAVGEAPWEVEAGEGKEDREQPFVAEPVAPAAESWGTGAEESAAPLVPQSELDRPASIPIISVPLPGEEPAVGSVEAAEAEWAEGSTAPADSWLAAEAEWAEEPTTPADSWPPVEVETGEAFPTAPPDEEPTEEWEVFPEPGRPIGSGQPPGTGAPGPEAPSQEAPGYAAGPAPRELTSGEVLAGAVTSEHRNLAEEVAAADTAEAHLQALSAPMAGLESGVVGFEDVVHLGGEEAYVEAPRSDLPVRVATGMVLVGMLLGAMWVGGEFLSAFVGLLAVLGLAELYATLRRSGYQPLALFGFLGAIGLLAGTWFYGLVAIPVAAVAVTVVCFFYYTLASRRRDPLTNGSLTLLGMLWVAGTVAFAFPIAVAPDFRVLVIALAATVIATDVGAFFAGRSWGAKPLAPVLSPNKTVEGLAGGVVLGVAAAVAIGYFLEPLNIRIGAGLGLVVAVMAPLGDLAESMVKRSLGVKDMGSILPGHGGILDRLDAYLFVLPAAWVFYEALGLLR